MTYPIAFLASLVTDSIAVASNDCAKDCLHKDHCVQAFGRNTLSKPHTGAHIALLVSLAENKLGGEVLLPPSQLQSLLINIVDMLLLDLVCLKNLP